MKWPTSMSGAVRALAAAGCLFAAGGSTHAAVVQAQFSPLGGDSWAAAFTVSATGAQVIESFTIFLDAAWARNVVVQASPAQWDTLAVQADLALASDAFVDALLVGPNGITAAAPLAGFEITFDWLDVAAPASLRFTVNDPLTFAALETGNTVVPSNGAVPEPATVALIAIALWASASTARKRVRG